MHVTLRRLGAASLAASAVITLTCSAASAATAATTPAAATAAPRAAPLSVRFVQSTRAVTAHGARFTGPTVTVTAGPNGPTGAARAITAAMRRHTDALATAFAALAVGAEQADPAGPAAFDVVQGDTGRSVHYLSVVLQESIDLGGAHPGYLTHAYVFDMATGREVTSARLFRNPHRVDRLVRAALVSANRRVGLTAPDVARLSILPGPGGRTAPLSCYPVRTGLSCVVDPGGALGFAAGPLAATVPWSVLSS